jgi:DNA (cytosine-5)-methyltransferase 1
MSARSTGRKKETPDRRDQLRRFWEPQHAGFRMVDLFAGCGGLTLGMHAAGWSSAFAVEKDAMAFDTYEHNILRAESPYGAPEWPSWLPQGPLDIEEILEGQTTRKEIKKLRGEIDLVAGGPPCQGFSVGGARRTTDPRNDLPYKFVEFVDLVRPKMVLLENVEGFDKPFLAMADGGRESYADKIKKEFQELGYTTVKMMLHAVDFGVPQTRRRVILLGLQTKAGEATVALAFKRLLRMHSENFHSAILPNTSWPVTIADALDDLFNEAVVPTPDNLKYNSPLYRESNSEYSALMRAHSDSMRVPDSHRLSLHTGNVTHLFQEAHRTQKAGRLPRQFLLDMGTKSRKKFLLDPDAPASTLTSHPDEFIHHREPRIITLRECARIQSFPDAFLFRGRYTLNGDRRGLDVSRCAQIGNAIPPLMTRVLGLATRDLMHEGVANLSDIITELDDFDTGQLSLEALMELTLAQDRT